MANKNFWIRNAMHGWSHVSGNELLVDVRNANVCYAAYKADNKIDGIIFFEGVPTGRNFPSNVRVIYNTPKEEIMSLRDKVEAGSAMLCLDFANRKLTKVFCYNKDTGE